MAIRILIAALLSHLSVLGLSAQAVGFVEIQGIPNGPANVFLDGEPWPEQLSDAPLLLELAPGVYRLGVSKPGFRDLVQELVVVEDEIEIVRVQLTELTTVVRLIHLLPAQVPFEVGRARGRTPATLEVPVGPQAFMVDGHTFCFTLRPDSAYVRIREGRLDHVRGATECTAEEAGGVDDANRGVRILDSVDQGPSFTPYTVAPDITNRNEVVRALEREYPPRLRDAGIRGQVNIWFFIDENGRVRDLRIQQSSGYDELDEAALRVAAVMQFTPALNRDRKVPVWIAYPVTFQVRD